MIELKKLAERAKLFPQLTLEINTGTCIRVDNGATVSDTFQHAKFIFPDRTFEFTNVADALTALELLDSLMPKDAPSLPPPENVVPINKPRKPGGRKKQGQDATAVADGSKIPASAPPRPKITPPANPISLDEATAALDQHDELDEEVSLADRPPAARRSSFADRHGGRNRGAVNQSDHAPKVAIDSQDSTSYLLRV